MPVGDNVQSHISTSEVIFTLEESGLAGNPIRDLTNMNNFIQYLNGRGRLTLPSYFEGIGVAKSGLNSNTSSTPDVLFQLMDIHVGITGDFGFKDFVGYTDQQFGRVRGLQGVDGFTIVPILLHPHSRGKIRLRSRNPFAKPRIYGNYFSDPRDRETLIWGVKAAKAIGESPPFKKLGAKFWTKVNPGCRQLQLFTDEYWRCVVSFNTFSVYHDVGSNSMGRVVDSRLRVFGIGNLRVADASVMPTDTTGGPVGPILMIAERVADFIRQDYG